ncbi:hypothetical protein OH146_11670 [Salinibacterium sp. SYSU T00001]|uniref:hypothetical protein n=1 Tax=Homoserinimonas sedimenticola TaxID=2986805 RepID=UPI0022366773|nr:hypothetical protein [Salinibacterium sedimenticola]MCW4386430.1 hypothetical protein [Salinibacterium sedimenticola]
MTVHRTPPGVEAAPALRPPWRALLLTTLLAASALLAPALPAAAESESPEAELQPASLITSPADGAFIDRNSLQVTGGGTEADAVVTITVDGTTACTTTVVENEQGDLVWQCNITAIADGAGRVIGATQERDDDEPLSDSVTVNVLGPPTIDPVSPTTGIVSGTARAGARVSVTLGSSAGACTATATSTRYWSCTVATPAQQRVPSGTYRVSARQTDPAIAPDGSYSAASARTIQVDTTAPAPPVITTPAGDYRLLTLPTTFSGRGEPGASVDVYLDGIPVCSARVVDGAWACLGGSTLTNAAHQVRAVQIDAAGNHSAPSPAIRVFFGPAQRPGTPTPTPTPSPSPTDAPSESPSTPTPSNPEPSRSPFLPPLSGDAGPDALTNWGTPTTFGDGLPLLHESVERGNWARSPLLALGAIALVALPLRLLANELRGRFAPRQAPLAGRNREPVPLTEQHTTGANPWLAIAVPFLITVAFMVIADGVKGEVRYLRLSAAVAIALAVLNLVGVAVAARFGRLWKGVDVRVRFRPMLLAAAIATGLLSRLAGLTPPLVSGTLIGARMPHDTPVRRRAVINLLQVATVLGLGLVGWVGHAIVGEVVGFWPTLTSEIYAALCLVGIGSTLVLLLPLGALPGRVVWEWHPWLWFAVTLGAGTVAFALLLGGASAHFPLATMVILAGVVAAVCLGAWAVLRFVVKRDA